jgi:hypothetical protein
MMISARGLDSACAAPPTGSRDASACRPIPALAPAQTGLPEGPMRVRRGCDAGCSRRSGGGGDEIAATVSTLPRTTHVEQLERVLLRRGLGALEADRDRCADCGRTPLTGEQVHVYAARQQRIVCELCRPRRRDAPVASAPVRHCEHGHAVRLMARAA